MVDSAIAAYELALSESHNLGPAMPRYYCRLARLYQQKKMNDEAIENYTMFLKIPGKADPIHKEPEDAQTRLARLKRGQELAAEVMKQCPGNSCRASSIFPRRVTSG